MYTCVMAPNTEVGDDMAIREGRNRLSELIAKARYLEGRTYLTNHGTRVAAVVGVEDAKLLEAIHRRPQLLACVRQAAEDDAAES
jgi:prevent-host-death family protein